MATKRQDAENNTILGLLRHGETEWNVLGKIQGSKDSPLTLKGKCHVAQWLPTLRRWDWDRIYASDLPRVKQTVAILNSELQLPVHYAPGLREQDWGQWEGQTLADIKKTQKKELLRQVAKGWEFQAPGGESRAVVRNRVFASLHSIVKKHVGEKLLLVCHQGIIKIIFYHLSSSNFLPGETPRVEPNNFHLIGYSSGDFIINTMNISRG